MTVPPRTPDRSPAARAVPAVEVRDLVFRLVSVRVALRPIARLRAGLVQIEGGALDARIDVESNDEIGSLGRSFNRMAAALERGGEREQIAIYRVDEPVEGIETVNGAIGLVDIDLAGGIETVNGDITIGAGSHVRGGITVEKANSSRWFPFSTKKRKPLRVVIAQDSRVDGPLHFEREVKLYVHSSAQIGPVTGATAVRYDGDRAEATAAGGHGVPWLTVRGRRGGSAIAAAACNAIAGAPAA